MYSSRSSRITWAFGVVVATAIVGGATGCASNESDPAKQVQVVPLNQTPPALQQFVATSLPNANIQRIERRHYEYSPEVEYYRIHYTDPAGREATVDYTPLQPEAHLSAYQEPEEQLE